MSKKIADFSASSGNRNYSVGYRRPPRGTRFKKGQSGNPNGRPKAKLNATTVVKKQMARWVPIRENGMLRKVTCLEALVAKAVNEALQGRVKPLGELLKLLEAVKLFCPDQLAEPLITAPSRVTIRIIKSGLKPDPDWTPQVDTHRPAFKPSSQEDDDINNN
jgi:hypothetical protein